MFFGNKLAGFNMAPTQIILFILAANTILMVSEVSCDSLADVYKSVSYKIHLNFPPQLFTSAGIKFSGIITINFSVVKSTNLLLFNYNYDMIKIKRIIFDGVNIKNRPSTYKLEPNLRINYQGADMSETDIFMIPLDQSITPGTQHSLYFEYNAIVNTKERNGLYKTKYIDRNNITQYLLVTQFAFSYARSVFPCFDDTAIRAKFNVSITFPTRLNILFSTREKIRTVDGLGMVKVHFETTPRIPVYLLGFIISKFTCTAGEAVNSVRFQVCSRGEVANKRYCALDVTPKLIKAYNSFTEYNYASFMKKLDLVAIPDSDEGLNPFRARPRKANPSFNQLTDMPLHDKGGVDNWGLTIKMENELLCDAYDISSLKQAVLLEISHMIAHQWFGNLVTFGWWTSILINEGLAGNFETYITSQVIPGWELEEQFVVDRLHKTLVHDGFDYVQPLFRGYEQFTVYPSYNDVLYNKGSSIMRMVQHFMGKDKFKEGIQHYIKKHKFDSIKNENLWSALDESFSTNMLNVNLSRIMETWIESMGYPYLTVSMSEDTVKIKQKKFMYTKSHAEGNKDEWYIPISYTVPYQKHTFEVTTPKIWLKPGQQYTRLPFPYYCDWILLNNQQTGYYRVFYEDKLLEKIRIALEKENSDGISELNRAYLIDDLFNFARGDLKPYNTVLDFVRFLKNDTSYFAWKAAMEGFGFLFGRFGNVYGIREAIMADILDLMESVYNSVRLLFYYHDQIESLKHELVLDWACRLGDEKCIKVVTDEFRQFTLNSMRPLNNRPIVYCHALRYSQDESDWYFLWDLHNQSRDSLERDAISSALGCSRNPELLRKYLEESIAEGSRFRFIDVMLLLIETIDNPVAIQVAFQFLFEHGTYIQENYQPTVMLEYIFVEIGAQLEEKEIEELERYIDDERNPIQIVNYGSKAFDAATEMRKWRSKYESGLLWYYFTYIMFHSTRLIITLALGLLLSITALAIVVILWKNIGTINRFALNSRLWIHRRLHPMPAGDIPLEDLVDRRVVGR